MTLLLAVAPLVALAQDITGTWNGTLKAGGQELRIVFDITEKDGTYTATMDSPDQGARGIPMSDITVEDNNLKIEAKNMAMMYKGTLKGDVIEGRFTQMAMSYRMDLRRGGVEMPRPQTPVPPFPYNSEEVVFENREAGITLAGTFTYPKEGSGFPAVVLLTGTGPQNRDEEIIGHKPFLVLADYLTRQGIAVLRFDDRGVGESGGDFLSATLQDFASDGAAGVDWLKSRPEVDAFEVGIVGHSGGGTQAIMIAAERNDVAFIVMLAGVAVKGDVNMREQRRLIAEAAGVPESVWQQNEELVERILSVIDRYGAGEVFANPEAYIDEVIDPAMKENTAVRDMLARELPRIAAPELQSLIKYDPTDALGRIKCPVLALNGAKDVQVPAAMNFEALQKYVQSDLTVKEYPGLNHLFQHSKTGNIMEYGTIEETMSPEVMADVAEWILQTTL